MEIFHQCFKYTLSNLSDLLKGLFWKWIKHFFKRINRQDNQNSFKHAELSLVSHIVIEFWITKINVNPTVMKLPQIYIMKRVLSKNFLCKWVIKDLTFLVSSIYTVYVNFIEIKLNRLKLQIKYTADATWITSNTVS